ncbi:MAG: hypothetical protein ACK4GQ_05535, partial [Candidatus Hadarchaeales archaeon]
GTSYSSFPDNVYSWAVRVENQKDNEATAGPYSSIYYFRVDTVAPPAPSLTSPLNGENTNDSTPTLQWGSVTDPAPGSGVLYYELWLDNKQDFSTARLENISGTSKTLPALVDNLYYWKVRVWDNAKNVGGFSTVWSFRVDTVAPPAPSLISPADGIKTNNKTPTLSWENTCVENSLPVIYYVEISDDSTFSHVNYSSGPLMDKIWVTSLLPDGRWYWRVYENDNAGNQSPWSTVRSFYVDTTAPAAPINLSVSPSGWTNINSFTVSWTNPSDLSGIAGAYYKFNSSPASPTDGNLVSGSGLNSITVQAPAEGANTIYVWLKDVVGNVNHANRNSVTLYLKTTSPSITLSPATGAVETATGWSATSTTSTYVITGTVPVGSTVKINGNPVSVSGDTFSLQVTLAAGVNTFTIQVTDQTGNTTTRTLAVTYTPPAEMPTGISPALTENIVITVAIIFLGVAALVVIRSFLKK